MVRYQGSPLIEQTVNSVVCIIVKSSVDGCRRARKSRRKNRKNERGSSSSSSERAGADAASRKVNRDGAIDKSERERERERCRYTVCLVFLPSGPECKSGFHCSFLVWVDDLSPSLPLRILSSLFLLFASPSFTVSLSVSLSVTLFSRSIPSRRTFKCHQPDRELGLRVSLYRVCLKSMASPCLTLALITSLLKIFQNHSKFFFLYSEENVSVSRSDKGRIFARKVSEEISSNLESIREVLRDRQRMNHTCLVYLNT